MSDSVAVIGSSIAGLHAAQLVARQGREVRVYESSARLDPAPRALIVTSALRDVLGDLAQEAVVNEVERFELHAGGNVVEVPLGRPDLIIERATLIRRLAERAAAAGAEIVLGHRLESLSGCKHGIDMRFRYNGAAPTHARVVVGADGAFSTVARQVGWVPQRVVPLVQAIVDLPADLAPQTARVFFEPEETPYFYWLIPESAERAALGVIGTDRSAARQLIDKFVRRHGLRVREYQGARIPEYRGWTSPRRRMGHGEVYLVGDAAGHVKVTTVGGVVDGLWGARGVAEAIEGNPRGGHALRSLRLELGLHRLIRAALNGFGEREYRQLLDQLDTAAQSSLTRHSRDESLRLLWDLVRRRPWFAFKGLRALMYRGRSA